MLNYHKTWRIINSGYCRAFYNMALDEAIAISVRKGDSPPTLRLYTWDKPSVSIGCFQKIRDVSIEYCNARGIPIVRRPTGGRAILHNKELTYSFSVKTDNGLFSEGLFDSYKKISNAFYLALTKVGFSPEVNMKRKTQNFSYSSLCFQSTSYGEITVNGRKIIGSAQKRWSDGLLQQGSIPYSVNESLIHRVFKLQAEQNTERVKEAMTGLRDVSPDLSDEEFRDTIKVSFEDTFDIKFIPALPSHEEEALAHQLETEKYQASEWNFRK